MGKLRIISESGNQSATEMQGVSMEAPYMYQPIQQEQPRQAPLMPMPVSQSPLAQNVRAPEARFPESQQPQAFGLREYIPEQAYMARTELRPWQMSQAVPGAGVPTQAALGALQTVSLDDQEFAAMLKKADPEVIVQRDRETNELTVYSPKTRKAYSINKPGLSWNDAMNIVSTILSAAPAGRATTLAGRAAIETGIQSGIEAAQAGMGGKFNIEEPVMAGGFSAGTDLLQAWRQASRAAAVERAATGQGVSPGVARAAAQVSSTATAATPVQAAQSFQQIVNPDPNVVRAAEQLGLQEVLPARVYSRNPQYVQVEQAIARMPGNALANSEKEAILAVAGKADEFINRFGGERDLLALNERIIFDFNNTLDTLRSQSDLLYDQITKQIPTRTLVETYEIRKYLVNKARDLGGIDALNETEKRIYNRVSRRGRRLPYGAIDDLRQDIGELYGQALKGNRFGDSSSYRLSGLYNALTEAQGAAIESVGGKDLGDTWALAKSLVAERKSLEESAANLLGREFSKPVIPKVVAAIKNLERGSAYDLEQTLNAIPEQYRQAALVSAFDSFFTQGTRTNKQLNMGQFASWWEGMTKNESARNKLMGYLPTEAGAFLDNLALISRQYSNAIASVPATGVVKAMGDFGSDNGFLAKILPMIPFGKGAAKVTGFMSAAKPDALKAASEMMNNPDFRRIVIRAAQGQETSRLEQRLMRSDVFQKWFGMLPSNYRGRMLTVGLGNYFVGSDEGEQ